MKVKLNNGKYIDVKISKKDNKYEYFVGNKKIGVCDPKVMDDNILILQNTIENEIMSQIKDTINNIDQNKIEIEAEKNKKIDEYIEESGIERVRGVRVVSLKKKENDKEYTDIQKEEEKKTQSQVENNHTKTTTKDINIKQKIKMDERANDMQDVRQWLGNHVPSDIEEIGIIESDEIGEMKDENDKEYKNNSTRYSIVAIGKDETVEPLQKYVPNLQQRAQSGNDPREEKYQVEADGTVEKDAVLSEYEIGNKVIQIDNKEYGRVEVNLGAEERTGNRTMGVQVRDSNTVYPTSIENRKVIGKYEKNGINVVDENIKEAEEHEKAGCEEGLTANEIDGDESTGHHHFDESQMQKYVNSIMENKNISDVFSEKEVKQRLEKNALTKKEMSVEESIKQTEEELAEDAMHFKTR